MEIPGYQIDRKIGKGGMASVYLATQISLDRSVVLKILDISRHSDSSAQIERFLAEGRIVAALNNPNIITIYDIGIADDNSLYISMEYIKGGDLKSRIGIPMRPEEALDILVKIGNGLNAAHQHGIIHRDVKPANILFRDDDTPLLTDFGIAKQVNNDLNLTSTGIFLGSPNYVSPEQADGKNIDGRTDIYSLGCIFYEMLTGEKPYKAETVFDVVTQHKNSPIPALHDDLQKYQPLLNKMMAKRPDERFADASEMLEFIKKLQRKIGVTPSILDFDITSSKLVAGSNRNQHTFAILLVLLAISAIFYGALQYVDIRLKDTSVNLNAVSVNTTLDDKTATINTASAEPATAPNPQPTEPVSPDVVNALVWLVKQSLEEYRLTYPPKDNAYYYFSRLLEINPQNEIARAGMLDIAERYANLAEKTLAENDYAKTEAYINIGLKINPNNSALLSLKNISGQTGRKSLMDALKDLFGK